MAHPSRRVVSVQVPRVTFRSVGGVRMCLCVCVSHTHRDGLRFTPFLANGWNRVSRRVFVSDISERLARGCPGINIDLCSCLWVNGGWNTMLPLDNFTTETEEGESCLFFPSLPNSRGRFWNEQ